jgi:hypothetical protein
VILVGKNVNPIPLIPPRGVIDWMNIRIKGMMMDIVKIIMEAFETNESIQSLMHFLCRMALLLS